jgi:hypothetical protein
MGVHGLTGENRVAIGFRDDSAALLDFTDSVRLGYRGIAFSAGAEWRVARSLSVAARAKRGGTLSVRNANANRTVGSGRAPDEVGASVHYDGIAGTVFAGRVG